MISCLLLSHNPHRNVYFINSFFDIVMIITFSPPIIIWYMNSCDKNCDLLHDSRIFYYVLGKLR